MDILEMEMASGQYSGEEGSIPDGGLVALTQVFDRADRLPEGYQDAFTSLARLHMRPNRVITIGTSRDCNVYQHIDEQLRLAGLPEHTAVALSTPDGNSLYLGVPATRGCEIDVRVTPYTIVGDNRQYNSAATRILKPGEGMNLEVDLLASIGYICQWGDAVVGSNKHFAEMTAGLRVLDRNTSSVPRFNLFLDYLTASLNPDTWVYKQL